MPKKPTAKKTKTSSTSDILGNITPVKKSSIESNTTCVICNKDIPQDRISALKLLGTPRTQWTHTKCSTTSKVKGIYMGEVGTSKLQLCDKIYNDSVRSVFKKTEYEAHDSDSEEEREDS